MSLSKGYRVYRKPDPPYSVLLENRSRTDELLMFESHAVAVLSAEESLAIKKNYTKAFDGYGCLGVLQIKSGETNSLYLGIVTSCVSVNKIMESEVFRITATNFIPLQSHNAEEEKINEMRKLLSSGTFYFSWSTTNYIWDLSLCAQRQFQQCDTDNRFFWNKRLHVHLDRFGVNCTEWLLKIISGGVEIRTIYAGDKQAKACLISRLSCERAGTRFNVRGTNDDGHVANFVETEQVIFLEDQISSFIQVRGSVPLFWEQPGIQVGSHKIRLSRGYEACAPAFDRHLNTLKLLYGKQVIVNLLGSKEGEYMLSQAFQNHHKNSTHKDDVPHIVFDYHAECRGGNLSNLQKLMKVSEEHLNNLNFFHCSSDRIIRQQLGTIRTNCVDCLDRTNSVQRLYGLYILKRQMEALGFGGKIQMVSRFEEVFKQIWTENGDHISRIYAGTGAMGGGRSKYSDAARSATRTIQNNFLDSNKQEAMDVFVMGSTLTGELKERAKALLTSRCLHAPEGILREMVARHREYTKLEKLRVCCGTWNVNGGTHFRSIAFKKEKLTDWLLDAHTCCRNLFPDSLDQNADFSYPADIFAIGFEEIVDLNASNIVRASTENSREWQNEIQKTISREYKYIPLATIQLVGVCLILFIRPHLAPLISDIAIESVKTGLGGATGNKGAVGVRFLLNATSFCFLCAHFAAGQSQVNERNNDFHEIMKRVSLQGKPIGSHDYIFWVGDFNYRIDLPKDDVKELVRNQNWTALHAADQLKIQMDANNVFRGFQEGETNFAPTYKYDNFSDDYDTSEKCRVPAWTDRILWRKRKFLTKSGVEDPYFVPVKQLLYSRVELRTSDHRPVIALFDIDYQKVDEEKKNTVIKDVIATHGPPDGTIIISSETIDMFAETLVDQIISLFSECGEILLVRFVKNTLWLVYKDGKSCLKALDYDRKMMEGHILKAKLKNPNWNTTLWREIEMCYANAEALYKPVISNLLGDDFHTEFLLEGNVDFDVVEPQDLILSVPSLPTWSRSSTPSSDRVSPVASDDSFSDKPTRPDHPPARPPLPIAISKSNATDGVSQKRAPPQRPGKPPPRPSSGPFKPKPKEPNKTENIVPISSSKISSISSPVNVQHHCHATDASSAEKMLNNLMSNQTTTTGGATATQTSISRSQTTGCLQTYNAPDDKSDTNEASHLNRPYSASVENLTMMSSTNQIEQQTNDMLQKMTLDSSTNSTPLAPMSQNSSTNIMDAMVPEVVPKPSDISFPTPPPVPVRRDLTVNKPSQPSNDVGQDNNGNGNGNAKTLSDYFKTCPLQPPPPLPTATLNPVTTSSTTSQVKVQNTKPDPPPIPSRPPSSLPPVPARVLPPPPPVPPRR
ncbi:synaptojanin-1-like isoform X1 [Octopus vulgaris]|uniref:phosphoinositide 5-phosphatase n=1 Tax=Octopus vulgaris TaxID=6645 RepID=A0AA36BBY6_OCTVU|nr:synaptojanin-1-like isoform X1 [Octopus vulgaris]